MRLRGQDSALILALLRVLCVSRDRSKRFLEDLEPQSRSAGGHGMSLCGPNSALILALLRVLCVSRDRSQRFLCDFPRVLWLGAQILKDLQPQSRSAGEVRISLGA